MNADKFFEKYSIEEISKRTKISPISLRYIKNKEYEKIPRVKFMGFVNIIQREFNIDLSDLIEEYNTATDSIPQKEETLKTKPIKKERNNLIFILSIILLLITGGLIYTYTSGEKETNTTQETPLEVTAVETNKTIENEEKTAQNIKENITQNSQKITQTAKSENLPEKNVKPLKPKEDQKPAVSQNKAIIPQNVTIIPNEKVWYKAINLDTNKTFEYLTSNPKTLPGSNYFIKFGHGNVTIEYGSKIIEPNTKKIVRILLKNGEYKYVDKGFRP